MSNIRSALKQILPQPVVDLIRKRNAPWKGNYPDWAAAVLDCSGYDQKGILEKVDQSTQKVVQGAYPYERDSVVFEQVEYSWPLLSGLLWSYATQGKLTVLDFGGALGSTYRQNKKFLDRIPHSWNIVEQTQFVAIGRSKYETLNLHFHESVEACMKSHEINTLLISSTLQYLSDPIDFLTQTLQKYHFPVVILDRLSIIEGTHNRITKQTVSKEIYEASYPCWFFSELIILAAFNKNYELVEKFDAHPFNETFIDGETRSTDHGFIFRLKTP